MTSSGLELAIEQHFSVLTVRLPEIAIICPYCGKAKNHCFVNVEKKTYRCFKCEARGTIYQLFKDAGVENLGKTIEELEDSLPLRELAVIHTPKVVSWDADTTALDTDSFLANRAKKYLASRNIPITLANQLNFKVGVKNRVLGTLVIPIYEDGKVASYLTRRFWGGGERYGGPHRGEAFVPKNELVYGLDRFTSPTSLVVVEGVFDALALWEYNAVALMGKVMSGTQAVKLLAKATSLTLLLDREGTDKDVERILAKLAGIIPIYSARMVVGKDPNADKEAAIQALERCILYEV